MAENQKNIGATYGLIAGLGICVFVLMLYLAGVKYFMSPLSWISYVIALVVAVIAGLKQKKINGGYLPFADALKIVFAVFALGFLLHTIFQYILLNYIDTGFRSAVMQIGMEKAEELMTRFGASQDQIDKALEAANKPQTLGGVFLGYALMCIVFFLISLIVAAIIQKKKPPFEI